MFDLFRKKKRLEKIETSGGFQEKKAAIEAKSRVADRILNNVAPSTQERRWHESPITFDERRATA